MFDLETLEIVLNPLGYEVLTVIRCDGVRDPVPGNDVVPDELFRCHGCDILPRESVFLGYSARLWLNVGNDAIYCTLEGDYAMPSENMLYAFENVLNAFEICQK